MAFRCKKGSFRRRIQKIQTLTFTFYDIMKNATALLFVKTLSAAFVLFHLYWGTLFLEWHGIVLDPFIPRAWKHILNRKPNLNRSFDLGGDAF